MPRVKCPKCLKDETVLRAGFIRGSQRFVCKECNYHFTIFKHRAGDKSSKKKGYATTIVDIAKIIGVSVSTVSRALKDHPDISEETKKAVKQIASELNYRPNTLAQSLSKRESRTIGVIIPDIETYFFASILTGIQKVASSAGYKVMISQSAESHKTEVINTHAFMNNWVDGLLICHSKETKTFDHIKLHLKSGIPIIHFDRVCEELNTPKVLLDDLNGSFQITEHLINQGCKRILLISGPKHLYISKRRQEGYEKALKNYNYEIDRDLICNTDLTIKSILEQVDQSLEMDSSIDAIFSISDMGAIRIIVHLKNKGIAIPKQIAIAGFGNDPMGEVIEPGLTSFNPHTAEIGTTVAQMFLDHIINGENQSIETKVVKGNLIIRESTLKNKSKK